MTVMMTGGVPAQLRPTEIGGSPNREGKTETTGGPPQPRPDAAQAPVGPRATGSAAFAAESPAAPAGSDPELWAILTAEERDLFARMNTMGPLTYGRPARAAPGAEPMLARGARLDVRA